MLVVVRGGQAPPLPTRTPTNVRGCAWRLTDGARGAALWVGVERARRLGAHGGGGVARNLRQQPRGSPPQSLPRSPRVLHGWWGSRRPLRPGVVFKGRGRVGVSVAQVCVQSERVSWPPPPATKRYHPNSHSFGCSACRRPRSTRQTQARARGSAGPRTSTACEGSCGSMDWDGRAGEWGGGQQPAARTLPTTTLPTTTLPTTTLPRPPPPPPPPHVHRHRCR